MPSSKRPICRRGSSSAPDPFNIHAQDPNRSCSSTLTIVRVPDEPSSPHRKSRLSFAFSSFHSGRPSSPTSPSAHFPTFKPRLTPDQVVDLARQAANPAQTSNSHVFTPLPLDVYLPFLDRPGEVAALISVHAKLFALLAQTFPHQGHPLPQSHVFPHDPTTWSYHHLIHHLTKIDRDLASDFLWSIAARKCILSHSELIWERVKGALGIPPELDVDYEFLEDDQPSPDGSEDGDVQGEKDDKWDQALLDSPLAMKPSTRLPPVHTADHGERKLPIERDFAYSEFLHSSLDDLPTPIQISIQPLVASSDPQVGSLGEGLGDIAEGAEEEEDEEGDKANALRSQSSSVLTSQIQGLRISTSPLSSSIIAATSPLTATGATAVPHPCLSSAPPTAHSRTSSVSSLVGPFNRSESTGALSSLWTASSQAGVFFSGSDAGDSHEDDNDKMHGVGPMFPGNFARLGIGLRRSSSSSSSVKRLPHARYIALDVGSSIPPPVEGTGTPSSPKEKMRAFSHTGGQRPFVQLAQRRRSWGAAGLTSLSGKLPMSPL